MEKHKSKKQIQVQNMEKFQILNARLSIAPCAPWVAGLPTDLFAEYRKCRKPSAFIFWLAFMGLIRI